MNIPLLGEIVEEITHPSDAPLLHQARAGSVRLTQTTPIQHEEPRRRSRLPPATDPAQRSRAFRLGALIVIIILMWLLVQCWGKTYDSVMEHCLGVGEEHTRYHLVMAVFVTVLVVIVVWAFDVDDLL